MGTARPFEAEKLVIGVLASQPGRLAEVRAVLEEQLGPVDFASDPVPFTFTRYYDREMGPDILRCWWALERLVDPAGLSGIKIATNAVEDRFREDGARKVNLDPGLLSLSRFVLATTKDSAHRVPLSGGIYADLTLVYEGGAWRPLAWTYPDYRSEEALAFLSRVREGYRGQLRGRRQAQALR